MNEIPTLRTCLTCHKSYDPEQPGVSKPFCCERCRLVDLGDWLDESYRIPERSPGNPFLPEEDSE